MSDIPPPPPGFTIQSNSPSPPPPGFTMTTPPPPPGFTMGDGSSRPAGATGLGMIGQTWDDLTNSNHPQHNANSLEQGIMDLAFKPGIIPSMRATYQQGIANGILMQPVRQFMEGMGIGRQPNETDEHFHQRYNQAIDQMRAQSTAEANSAQIGGGPNPTLADRGARLGQQVANFGAGILANPEYLLAPGMGVGGNMATRIGTAAAGNAAIGSASDAAAQLMDQAEGQKKSFDIDQNLQAAVFGAGVGAVGHGVVEAAPFVKSLFGTRGVDTTPQPDPRTSPISPMTTDHVQMNATDHMQYQQLLNTGSVDDIKNFFKGRNGPQPSWQEVNDWVEHRDNPPVSINGQPGPDPTRQPDFNYQDEYNNYAEQQWAETQRQAVEDHVTNQMSGWSNPPNVEVVHGPSDIADPTIRAQAIADDSPGGENPGANGFYGADGVTRIYSGRVETPEQVNALLYHEGLGHFGLAQKFGDRLDSVLQSLLARNVNQLSRDTDAWQKRYPGAYGGDRIRAAEEVLAERSEKGVMPKNWQNAVSSAVRQFGRKMGLNLAYSDAEVNHILAMAHDAVINGKPSARANGFSTPNKFMYAGKQSQTQPVSEDSWFNGADSKPRYEVSDEQSKLKDWDNIPAGKAFGGEEYQLDNVLDHPRLYNAYPELKNVKVTKNPALFDVWGSQQGSYNPSTNSINITPYAKDPHSTLLHEIQHWIQDKEGWSPGGNENSVSIVDKEALAKLRKFYERRVQETKNEPTPSWTSTSMSSDITQRKLDTISELEKDDHPIHQQTKIVNDLNRKYLAKSLELKRLEQSFDDEHAKKVNEYEKIDDSLKNQVEKLRQDRDQAIRERRFSDANMYMDKLQDLQKQRFQNKFPFRDYTGEYEQLKSLKKETNDLRVQVQDARSVVNDLSKRYGDIGYDLYRLIAGEREARDVQKRQLFDDNTRQTTPPYSSEGIKDDEVIHTSQNKFMRADSQRFLESSKRLEVASDNIKERVKRGELQSNPESVGMGGMANYVKVPDLSSQLTSDGNVYHETNLAGARGLLSKLEGPMVSHAPTYVTPNRDLALGQGGRGITLELDPKRLQGFVPDSLQNKSYKAINGGEAEAIFDQSVRGATKAIHVSNERQINSIRAIKGLDNRFDFDNPVKTDTGYRIDRYPDGKKPDNKFMRRDLRQQATEPGYNSDDPDRVYDTLNKHYEKTSMTTEEIRRNALENGINPSAIKDLAKRDPGELASRVYRLGAATNLADVKLRELEEHIGTPKQTVQDSINYIKAIADFNYIAPRFKEETSAMGRALNIAKAFPQYTNATLKEIGDLLREHGQDGLANMADDPEALLKFARQLQQVRGRPGSNLRGVQTMLNAVNKPYWWQYLTTFHMNMMLSALSTHVKAPIDMSTGITRNVIEKVAAMPIGQVRQLFEKATGKTPEPGVETAELINHIIGIARAVTDAEVYKAGLEAAKTGDSSYVVNGNRTPTNFAGHFGVLSNPRFQGPLGFINKPTDLIAAQDTVFRSVEMNAQLESLGVREAREQLGPNASTSDVMTLGHTLAMNPTPTMLKEAFHETNKTLLLNDNPINNWINKARSVRPGMTPLEQATSFFVSNLAPFIRVESNNLINRIVDRSPLGFLKLMDPKSDLNAGGAKADIALSKIIYGSALLGIYWNLADTAKNYLTGEGTDNTNKYKEKIASGWRPNAVHENGGYNTGGQLGMSVNPFDAHNKTAQIVAAARQAIESGMSTQGAGAAFKLAVGSIFSNLANMSWLSDIHPAVDALTAHGQEGESTASRFASSLASSWLPNGMNQMAKMTDQIQRDPTAQHSILGTVGNTLATEVPGLRQNVPIKYSVYGDPLANGASLTGVHTWVPGLSGNGTTETQDLTERELDRLSNSTIKDGTTLLHDGSKAMITPVSHTINKDPDDSSQGKIQLNTAQIEEYQRLAGKSLIYWVKQDIDNGTWSKMTDAERYEEVRSIESDVKKAAAQTIRESIK